MTLNGFWRAFVLNTVFRKVFLSVLAYFEAAYFVCYIGTWAFIFKFFSLMGGEGVDCEHEVFRLPLICISLNENRDLISTSLFEVLCHMLKMRA